MPASNCSSQGSCCHLDCSGLGEQCRWMEKGNQTGCCRWIAGVGHHHQPLSLRTSCLDSTEPRCSLKHILPLVPGYPNIAALESCLSDGIIRVKPIYYHPELLHQASHPSTLIHPRGRKCPTMVWTVPVCALGKHVPGCWRREKKKRNAFICKEFALCVSLVGLTTTHTRFSELGLWKKWGERAFITMERFYMVLSSLEDVNFSGGYSMKESTKDNGSAKWPLKPLQLCQGKEQEGMETTLPGSISGHCRWYQAITRFPPPEKEENNVPKNFF